MGRLVNARENHVTRWVIPAASRLLIEASGKSAPTKPLEKVAHIEMGQSPKGDLINGDGVGFPLIGGPADLGIETPNASRWTDSPTKLCKDGDIIVCVRATIGEPRWADGVYCLGRGVAGIRPISNDLDAKFLFRVIEGNEGTLREQGTGTTFKTISKIHLASIQVPMIPASDQKMIGDFLEWLEHNSEGRPDFSEAPRLPESLSEQRRIVARIEELAAKIAEAKGLREQVSAQSNHLCRSVLFGNENGTTTLVPMSQLVNWRKPDIKVSPLEDYHFAGVYCFGRGVFSGAVKKGSEFSYKELTRLETEDFVYPKLMAWEGAFGVVPPNCDGLFVSPEFPVFSVKRDVLLPETLDIYFKTPSVWPLVAGNSTGTNVRRRRLNPNSFLEYRFPLPSMETQLVAREIRRRTTQIGALQTQAELDALLPSILDRAFKGEL